MAFYFQPSIDQAKQLTDSTLVTSTQKTTPPATTGFNQAKMAAKTNDLYTMWNILQMSLIYLWINPIS